VVLDDAGVLSGPLRFRDEFVRHKVLDLVGDLALLGVVLDGHIHARRAGHALHIEFARALAAAAAAAGKETPVESAPERRRAARR
jgi:UDP-3-O-[3-hydroxymyristoyl] N-acetylglucosamine deacetylase